MPPFLLDIKDCVADRLLGIATERLLRVADVALDHNGLAPRVLALHQVEEVFGGEAIQQLLVEVGEGLLFFFGEAVKRSPKEDTRTDTSGNGLAVARTFEVRVLAVRILLLALGIGPSIFNGESAREDESCSGVRARSTLGIRVGEFGLVGTGLAKNPRNGKSHNR